MLIATCLADVEVPVVIDLECREITGDMLDIALLAAADVYVDVVPAFEDLNGAIEVDTTSGMKDEPTEAEIDIYTFVEPSRGYSVTFNDSVWNGAEPNDGTIPGLRLTSNEDQDGFGTIVFDAVAPRNDGDATRDDGVDNDEPTL